MPSDEPLAPALTSLFAGARADWRIVRNTIPPDLNLCPTVRPQKKASPASMTGAAAPDLVSTEVGDRWFPQEFANTARALAQELGIEGRGRDDLMEALNASSFRTMSLPTTVQLLTNRIISNHTIGRRAACSILQSYLEPLLSRDAFVRWLDELARGRFFIQRGASGVSVPMSIMEREQQRDRELLERWSGSPPQVPVLGADASKQRERALGQHEKESAEYERRRKQGRAMLRTDQEILSRPRGTAAKHKQLPLIGLGATVAPANLYISEVAPILEDYFVIIRGVLTAGDPGLGVASGFASVAYGVLTLASVPLFCLYDTFHGSCVVETVAPRIFASMDALGAASRSLLQRLVAERLRMSLGDVDERAATRYSEAFSRWIEAVQRGMRGSLFRLMQIVADQGGGRIRTPDSLTNDGKWVFELSTEAEDGSEERLQLVADEALSYEEVGSGASVMLTREVESEIFWMLPGLWEPLSSAVALANQSGARVWINAANNRWGGHHPPHRVHRQGVSLDVDVGLAWRRDKVKNVVKRDYVGLPLAEAEAPGNAKNIECLHSMERIAGWIVTQSFILVGVTQYLYGDAGIVEQAYLHLKEYFDISRPARMDGKIDAEGHNDHWHFEMLLMERPTRVGPYVLQATSSGILERLRELAIARDQDAVFWKKFAGLESVPNRSEDFKGLPDAEEWRRWWELRTRSGGVPLLPVWAPRQAKRTYEANQCWAPKGDFPDAFEPGTAPA